MLVEQGIGRPYGGGSYSVSKNGTLAFNHTTPYHPAELAINTPKARATKLVMSLNDDILGTANLRASRRNLVYLFRRRTESARLDCQTTFL